MKIQSIHTEEFKAYGSVLTGYDFAPLLAKLEAVTPMPPDSVVYVPGDGELEKLEVAKTLSTNAYGGMPIQVGYCNGYNKRLNCLEYHRGCEVNVAGNDMVLLLALMDEIEDGKLDTAKVKAFLVKKGEAVIVRETTLHYAPCAAKGEKGFRVVIVLPKGTNHAKPLIKSLNDEDTLLWASNKWLLAHETSNEAKEGAYVGLCGKNIEIE